MRERGGRENGGRHVRERGERHVSDNGVIGGTETERCWVGYGYEKGGIKFGD